MQISVSSVSSVVHRFQEHLTTEDAEDTEDTLSGSGWRRDKVGIAARSVLRFC